ncbi:hypothetical protein EJB05_04940, partial [Eragrostis curvula]
MSSSTLNQHETMRGRDVGRVARGEQAPRPPHEPGSISDSPPRPPESDKEEDWRPMIELRTAPTDFRFPTTNQTRHCYVRYLEYHRCLKGKDDEHRSECDKFQRWYRSLCPTDWVGCATVRLSSGTGRGRKGSSRDPSDPTACLFTQPGCRSQNPVGRISESEANCSSDFRNIEERQRRKRARAKYPIVIRTHPRSSTVPTMATFLGSSPALVARPVAKPHVSCTQSSRPPSSQGPPNGDQQPQPQQSVQAQQQAAPQARPKRSAGGADSTDWVASSLTRRFGIGAGLAWAGFLAVGVVSEQLKTRFEVAQQQANTKSGRGAGAGGGPAQRHPVLRAARGRRRRPAARRPGGDRPAGPRRRRQQREATFVDTFGDGKRPLALVMGSRPYTRGMCDGVEYVLRSMKAGGKRRVVVPPSLGFGDDGADFGMDGAQVPPGATLEYIVQIDKVSIAPA